MGASLCDTLLRRFDDHTIMKRLIQVFFSGEATNNLRAVNRLVDNLSMDFNMFWQEKLGLFQERGWWYVFFGVF